MSGAMSDAEELIRRLAARRSTGAIEVSPVSSGGGNYTTSLFAVSAPNFKAFAKVALVGEKLRDAMNAEVLYGTEQSVYSDLAPLYKELISKTDGKVNYRFPEIYGLIPEVGKETILMEDLTAEGYRVPPRHESLDWKFATTAVSKLATFHALSFALEKEHPEGFQELVEKFRFVHKHREDEPAMMETWQRIIGAAVKVVRDEHKERVVNLLKQKENFQKFKTPLSRTVLCHGDYRGSNLLCKHMADGGIDIVVVDYQTVHSGCPVTDLLYLIFMGTNQKFRQIHYQDLLDHYHSELARLLDDLGVDVDEVYPKDVFESEVKELLPVALSMAAIVLPLVLVDEKVAPKIESADADHSAFAVAPTDLFAERFSSLVEDCILWGAL